MRSVYVIGGAGTGKSTFTAKLLERLGLPLGLHEGIHTVQNKAGRDEILKGHVLGDGEGFYIGRDRESFPGTDGLSRSTVIAGESWLMVGSWRPEIIVAEGATFATKGFLTTLHQHTDMFLAHLTCPPEIVAERFKERGSDQDPSFVKSTVTRSQNNAEMMVKAGCQVATIDSSKPVAVQWLLDVAVMHLSGL